jgi:hypothetical protein
MNTIPRNNPVAGIHSYLHRPATDTGSSRTRSLRSQIRCHLGNSHSANVALLR